MSKKKLRKENKEAAAYDADLIRAYAWAHDRLDSGLLRDGRSVLISHALLRARRVSELASDEKHEELKHVDPTSTLVSARVDNREDWLRAIATLPELGSLLQFDVVAPMATLTRVDVTSNRNLGDFVRHDHDWLLLPLALRSRPLLHLLREATELGYKVSMYVGHRGTSDLSCDNSIGPLLVKCAVPRFQGEPPGIYLYDDAGRTGERLMDAFSGDKRDIMSGYMVHPERFWADRVTHLVAPTADGTAKRLAYSFPSETVAAIHADLAAGGPCSALSIIEAKTPVYRFYVDVDFNPSLEEACSGFAALKTAQRRYFGGDGKVKYSGLTRLVNAIYPARKGARRALVSRRAQATSEKNGHHVIYSDLHLPNDGRQGLVLAGQLEAACAAALSRGEHGVITRFLLGALRQDNSHLGVSTSPITFRIDSASATFEASLPDSKSLETWCSRHIEFMLRDDSVHLSPDANSELVRLALRSIGSEGVQRYVDRLADALTLSARARVLRRLAKRCRWEMLRRARYFDHSVYAPTMGLRLVGCVKPDDPQSQYLPTEGELKDDRSVTQHSIRTRSLRTSRASDAHALLLKRLGIFAGRCSLAAQTLDGLFANGRLRESFALHDLHLHFEIRPPASRRQPRSAIQAYISSRPSLQQVTRSLRPQPQLLQIEWDDLRADSDEDVLTRYARATLTAKRKGTNPIILRGPRRRLGAFGRRALAMQKRSVQQNLVEIRVRVFIPSPIVDAPGDDYGGDGRGPDYSAGTSRLDIDIQLDLSTAQIQWRAAWGETTKYDSSDTVPTVGKPSWWRDKVPGATPIESGRLAVSSSNVGVSATPAASGVTVNVTYEGANPLAALAPPINGNFTLGFNSDGSLDITAQHDGFPAHTMYVNGSAVYEFDPEIAGTGPFSLFGPGDQSSTRRLDSVPNSGAGSGTDGGPEPGEDGFDATDGEEGISDDGADGDISVNGDDEPVGNDVPEQPDAVGDMGGSTADGIDNAGSGQSVTDTFEITANGDGSVTAETFGAQETFSYDPSLGGWVGDGGSFLIGGPDLFDNTSGWSVTISIDEFGNVTVEICNADGCSPVRIEEHYGP